ncbi:hypothetical protein BVY04_01390 [bacterium M21]|nr:hypothetical protein BVY04_01390 [bacterium M21]
MSAFESQLQRDQFMAFIKHSPKQVLMLFCRQAPVCVCEQYEAWARDKGIPCRVDYDIEQVSDLVIKPGFAAIFLEQSLSAVMGKPMAIHDQSGSPLSKWLRRKWENNP